MGAELQILTPENMSTKEKSPCNMANIENESPCQVRVCKKLSLCQFEGSEKNSAAKGLSAMVKGGVRGTIKIGCITVIIIVRPGVHFTKMDLCT